MSSSRTGRLGDAEPGAFAATLSMHEYARSVKVRPSPSALRFPLPLARDSRHHRDSRANSLAIS